MRAWTHGTLLVALVLVGCAEEIRGPDASLSGQAPPGVACNANDPPANNGENRDIQTPITLRAPGDAGVFSPLPINVVAGDAGIELPQVFLLPPGGGNPIEVRQTEFVSNTEMRFWITRTTNNGAPLQPGVYGVRVRNPNGSEDSASGVLRVTPPPVIESVRRIQPPVPAGAPDPNEARIVCSNADTTLAIVGQNFRPRDPKPIVQILPPAGAPIRVPDADVMVASETEIHVVLRGSDPAMRLPPGTYGFRVTNPDGELTIGYPQGCHSTRMDLFTVVPPPEITSIEPVAVCASRGNTFDIVGAHFRAGVQVTINAATPYMVPSADTQVMSTSGSTSDFDRIRITVPAGAVPAGGPYALTVRNLDGCGVTLEPACPAGATPTGMPNQCSNSMGTGPMHLTFYPDPTITAVMPMAACIGTGMSVVTITGTGFHATYGVQPTVTINGVMATSVTVGSDTSLSATLPAMGLMAGGPYDVTVTLPEGCGATASMALTIQPGPAPAAILPNRGWNMIDMPVTILGDGFVGVTAVVLRGAGPGGTDYALTDVQVVDPTQINATIPAGAVAGGPYDVVVRSAGGCDGVLAMGYTVQSTPSLTVSSVVPPFGWTGGSTPITIRGAMFQSTPRAYLVVPSLTPRMRPLQRTVFASANTLTSVVPMGLPVGGPYDLVVINPDGGGGVLRNAFRVTANPPPTIESVTPDASTTSSATTVTITGNDFRSPVVTFTLLGSTMPITATVTASSATSITVTVPTNTMTAGAYIVRVTNPDEMTYGEYGTFVVTNPASKLGAFTAASPLNVPRRGLGVAPGRINAANRFIYAVGGDSGSGATAPLGSIEFAQVDIDGRLGAWTVQRYALATPRTRLGLVRQGGYLYAIGGSSTVGTVTALASVERARILTFVDSPVVNDPTITRATTGGLDVGSWIYRVAAIKDPIADPENPDGETLPSDEVVATLVRRSNVTITWAAVPGARAYRVYRTPMVNGASGTEVLLADNVMGTTFTDDGSLTPMAPTPDTTPLRVGSTGRWLSVAALNTARDGVSVTVAPDPMGQLFVYAIGGRSGPSTVLASYEFATISADGRTLGTWTAGTTSLGTGRYLAAAVTATRANAPVLISSAAAFVYATGGFSSSTSLNSTEFATVIMGGQLGSFTATGSYANRRGGTAASVVNSFFYVMGGTLGMTPASMGTNTSNIGDVSDMGSLSSFSSASNNMLVDRLMHGLALESAYFYVVGGSSTGSNALTNVDQVIH